MTPWWLAVVVPLTALGGSLTGTLVTRGLKGREENRLLASHQLEADLRVAEAFSQLMRRAHGRGPDTVIPGLLDFVVSRPEVHDLMAKAAGGDDLAYNRVRILVDLAIGTGGVGTADMDAAAQMIASLADRYAILRPAAFTGLSGRNEFREVPMLEDWKARWGVPGADNLLSQLLKED